jgi:glycosyltransferase involved in cell wall biosynthesis
VKALHVIPSVAARYGGPSAAIVPMCRALIGQGVETTIATTDADGEGRLPVDLERLTTWQGVPAIFFRRNFSEAFKYSRGLARWVRTHVAEFDVVHIHAVLSHAPLVAATACRRAGVPYVVRPLGTIAEWSLGQKTWRKQALIALSAGRMLRSAAAIHCTSDSERLDAERRFGLPQTVVIPLGIESPPATVTLSLNDRRTLDPYVLFLARLHPKKNVEALIDAFADVSPAHPGWRLVIAGDGDADYVRALEAQIRALPGRTRVQMTGWVDGDRKAELFTQASLFALPSRHENFGVAVVEALAAGVPVLATPQVPLADMISAASAGWTSAPDRASLAATLHEAMKSRTELERRGQRAQVLAARYTWPGIAEQLLALYEQIARNGRTNTSTAQGSRLKAHRASGR